MPGMMNERSWLVCGDLPSAQVGNYGTAVGGFPNRIEHSSSPAQPGAPHADTRGQLVLVLVRRAREPWFQIEAPRHADKIIRRGIP
jgi:hypothetical protein